MLRMRAQSPRLNSAINPKKACQAALANALVSTPDPLKVQVLWELYWLLRRQDSIRDMHVLIMCVWDCKPFNTIFNLYNLTIACSAQ